MPGVGHTGVRKVAVAAPLYSRVVTTVKMRRVCTNGTGCGQSFTPQSARRSAGPIVNSAVTLRATGSPLGMAAFALGGVAHLPVDCAVHVQIDVHNVQGCVNDIGVAISAFATEQRNMVQMQRVQSYRVRPRVMTRPAGCLIMPIPYGCVGGIAAVEIAVAVYGPAGSGGMIPVRAGCRSQSVESDLRYGIRYAGARYDIEIEVS